MSKESAAAAAAFEQTLDDLDLSEADVPDPGALGRRAALLAVADVLWARHLGPLLDGKQVQLLLGVRTRQAVNDLVQRGRLLGLPGPDGELAYPAFQFSSSGRPYEALRPILEALSSGADSPHTLASWFRTPQSLLRGATPAAWLAEEKDAGILLEAARRTGALLRR